MAMRITTKMMQNRSLNNLNTNKTLQEKLTTQLSTMKKITRPSDDPVIAIRSLKLNASLDKIDQYYEKNAKDAASWLQLTESAIDTTVDIITGMRTYIEQAAQGSLEASDRAAILENLSNYKSEIYATGNADSDGRSIFTGYRTNTPLTFKEDKTDETYRITEQWNNSCLDVETFVKTGDLSTINEGNFSTKATTEYGVDSYEIPRIRLAYDNLDEMDSDEIGLSYRCSTELSEKTLTNAVTGGNYIAEGVTINTGSMELFAHTDLQGGEVAVSYTDENGVLQTTTIPFGGNQTTTIGQHVITINQVGQKYEMTIESNNKTTTIGLENNNGDITYDDYYETTFRNIISEKSAIKISTDANGTENYMGVYEQVLGDDNADNIVFVAETGELLLGANVQAELAELSQDAEIRITYEKSDWKQDDLDPIHYFYTERTIPNGTGTKTLVYNEDKLTDSTSQNAQQIIEYDIGSNQTIRVNTTADEIYTHDIGRDIDEVVTMLEEYQTILDTQATVEDMIDSGKYDGDELTKLEEQLAGLEKAATLAKDKVQKTCEGLLTTFDGYLKQTALAQTDCGSRESRLNLIQNRLSAQQTNFQELVSENEDADVTDLAIQLSSVELTYEAALSSISYVMQTSLLDFL